MGIDAALEGVIHNSLVDISQFAGIDGDLIFSLNSVGSANADFYIGGLALLSTSQVPEPTTTALLALGLLGIGFARKRRTHKTNLERVTR